MLLALLLLGQLALAAAAPAAAAPTAAAASAPTASFAAAAHAVRKGGKLQVTNYKLEGDVTASTMQLTRIEVFSPNAQVSSRFRDERASNTGVQVVSAGHRRPSCWASSCAATPALLLLR